MKALLYPRWDAVEMADVPMPVVADDEVLVKVHACGICGSELEAFRNHSPRRTPPLVMGHEFCGEIASLGAGVTGQWRAGQRVVCNALVPCGNCARCNIGRPHLCAQRQIFGMNRLGALGQFVNVPARSLIDWPQGLPAEAACLAEPLGNGVHVANLAKHIKPSTVLVIGAGPIGLLAMQAAAAITGATVFAADLSPERLAAATRCGAEAVFNPREGDVVEAMRKLTGGEGVDVVVDAVGGAVTKQQSLQAVRPGGMAVWIGLHDNAAQINTFDITLREVTVQGTYAATLGDMQHALQLLAQGRIEYQSWITRLPLTRADEAFNRALAAKGSDIKMIVMPGM